MCVAMDSPPVAIAQNYQIQTAHTERHLPAHLQHPRTCLYQTSKDALWYEWSIDSKAVLLNIPSPWAEPAVDLRSCWKQKGSSTQIYP